MFRRMMSAVLLVAFASSTVACHSYVLVRQPLEFIASQRPPEVIVTGSDGAKFSISGPQVFGDTVVGYVNGQYQEVKFNNVGQVRVRQNANGKTALLIIGGAAGVVGIAWFVSGLGAATQTGNVVTDCDDDPTQPGCY